MNAPPTCRDGAAVLMDYLEGALSAAEAARIDEHVARCPRCVAFIRSYRETPRILRGATEPAIPADLADSLRRFLQARRDA